MVARSKKHGLPPPEFTKNEIIEAIRDGRCQKTGILFEFGKAREISPWTPVPDRIHRDMGYTKGNVQWVCHMYNCMKGQFSEGEVRLFLTKITEFNGGAF